MFRLFRTKIALSNTRKTLSGHVCGERGWLSVKILLVTYFSLWSYNSFKAPFWEDLRCIQSLYSVHPSFSQSKNITACVHCIQNDFKTLSLYFTKTYTSREYQSSSNSIGLDRYWFLCYHTLLLASWMHYFWAITIYCDCYVNVCQLRLNVITRPEFIKKGILQKPFSSFQFKILGLSWTQTNSSPFYKSPLSSLRLTQYQKLDSKKRIILLHDQSVIRETRFVRRVAAKPEKREEVELFPH